MSDPSRFQTARHGAEDTRRMPGPRADETTTAFRASSAVVGCRERRGALCGRGPARRMGIAKSSASSSVIRTIFVQPDTGTATEQLPPTPHTTRRDAIPVEAEGGLIPGRFTQLGWHPTTGTTSRHQRGFAAGGASSRRSRRRGRGSRGSSRIAPDPGMGGLVGLRVQRGL
jgi:hypothetical protein